MSKKITSLFNFKKLQKFSSALMLPIAILPAAGLILAIGCIDSLEVRKKLGGHWIIRDLAGLDLVGLASQ